MATSAEEIQKDDVKAWLSRDVATEIEELRSTEIPAAHAKDSYRGILAWFAKYYIDDDPELLTYPDGPNDGGIDVASISTTEHETHVDIYQLSAPDLENIADGRLTATRAKFADDIRQLYNTVHGKARKLRDLNPTAQEVLRQINRARDLAREGESQLTVEVHPLSLRLAHPEARREVEGLIQEANDAWSEERVRWILHPINDAYDLYRKYLKKRPKDQSPDELRLTLRGPLAADNPERGPFLCFFRAIDLVEAYRRWGPGLLDANLRYSLGKTEVNRLIENELTHVSSVKWFHEKNNGIVFICNSCQESKGFVRLTSPQIVNGGQTVHTLTKVFEDLEAMPLEQRSEEQKRLLTEISANLRLSARIVTVSGGAASKPEDIAIASNTQNKLSERTMKSPSLEMRDLRLSLAAGEKPWFVETKDGEWPALVRQPRMFQSKTGNKRQQDFRRHNRTCRIENTDLAVASLAFYGFVAEAKQSRVFKPSYFPAVFSTRPKDSGWRRITEKRFEWKGKEFGEVFEDVPASASLWLVTYFVWLFWKTWTYPESRQLLIAYEEAGHHDPEFASRYQRSSGWEVPEEARDKLLEKSDSCYWTEQVAKSAYLVLCYQTMRLLVRCYGNLDEETCMRLLSLRQFSDLYDGGLIGSVGDFRSGSLKDGPLTTIGRVLHYASELLWQRYETRIRQMASRQQVLLQEDWVARLSEQVDEVCTRIVHPPFRHASKIDGPADAGLEIGTFCDLLQ
jgi:hypothetical protein